MVHSIREPAALIAWLRSHACSPVPQAKSFISAKEILVLTYDILTTVGTPTRTHTHTHTYTYHDADKRTNESHYDRHVYV